MVLDSAAGWDAQHARDRLLITEALFEYARLIDQGNHEGALVLFTETPLLNFGPEFGGPTRGAGPVAAVLRRLAGDPTSHHVSNVQITFLTSDRAVARSYAIVRLHPAGGAPATTIWGEFEDRLERTPEGWRFLTRVWRAHLQDGPALRLAPAGSDDGGAARAAPPPAPASGAALPGLARDAR